MNFNVISPKSTPELLDLISQHQDNNFRFCAGGTDLLLEIKKQPSDDLTVINLAQLDDRLFTSIAKDDKYFRLGALVSANQIINDNELRRMYPVLYESADKLASRQIRQVATIGGNICTASPAGDIACALVALEAQCEILAVDRSVRIVPLSQFFLGVRKTNLKKNEILRSIIIPNIGQQGKIHSGFIKVGTRRSMEIAVVSLAFHLQTNKTDEIIQAGIAIGSIAPVIKFCQSACDYLKDRKLAEIGPAESEAFASKALKYASPISDIRASAWYRSEVLFNISKSIFEQ
ncbi:FAD binding domain-containing protein [bacterium]|nr:FAD binding domain-containing protein [FCB group bacterium]MBL7191001.1 FAD binding domain-containing protein [bacterium]